MRRTYLVATVVALCGLASTSCSDRLPWFGGDTVSYRPDTATTAESADCLAEDIYTALTGLGPWDPAITETAPEPGYPPSEFEAVEVVSCQRGLDQNGVETVDSVQLGGDVDAVLRAFSVDSQRFADGVSASCVYEIRPPVGLWLVDDAGRAFRPMWPASPCGQQEGPLAALQALEEVGRTVHPTGYDTDFSSVCTGSTGFWGFESTTSDDVEAATERERAGGQMLPPALGMPVDDVGYTDVCRYPVVARAPSVVESAPGSSLVLGEVESASVVRTSVNAPIAQACGLQATRHASAQLLRPDGSGGAVVSFELDGCQRSAGFGGYREIPADVHEVLMRGVIEES